jgi:hypothetical protein
MRIRKHANAHGLSANQTGTCRVFGLPKKIEEVAFTIMRARASFAVFAAYLALGCGSSGHASSGPGTDGGADATHEGDDTSAMDGSGDTSEAGHADGATADAGSLSSDAGSFACGEIVCSQTEVCVHQASGCMIQMPRDAGTCPDGSTTSDAGSCESSSPAPYCWSPDAGTTLICDEGDGGLSGVFNSLPPGTDLVCYSSCI